MTAWHLGRMCAYDLETDAANPLDARIITAAVIGVGGTIATDARGWVLRPVRPIPDGAAAIHGYTTERAAAEGMDPADAVNLIAAELCMAMLRGVPVVSHNASYDWTVLARELDRYGLPSMEDRLDGKRIGPVVDTYVIDKACDRYRKGSRTLTAAAKHYGVALEGAHDATYDALAAARIFYRMGQLGTNVRLQASAGLTPEAGAAFSRLAQMTLWELHDAQIEWAAEQAVGLAAYFRKTGKAQAADEVDGSWPVRIAS